MMIMISIAIIVSFVIIVIIIIVIIFLENENLLLILTFCIVSWSFPYLDNLHCCILLLRYQVPDQNNPCHRGLGEDLCNNAFGSDDQYHKLQNTQSNHPTESTHHYLENIICLYGRFLPLLVVLGCVVEFYSLAVICDGKIITSGWITTSIYKKEMSVPER